MDILTKGQRRFFTEALVEEKPYLEADVRFFEDVEARDDSEALKRARTLLAKLSDADYLPETINPADFEDPRRLSFAIPSIEGFTPAERQRFLEMTSAAERLQKGVEVLSRIVERVQVTQQIRKIIGGNGHPPKGALSKLPGAADAAADG
jgi:Lon protease-like protein